MSQPHSTPTPAPAPTDETASPQGRRRWIALAILATGLSLIIIDGTIVNVAIPVIITDLNLDLVDAQWINGSYAVVFAALLLTTGRLGDRLGRRRLFLVGLVLFAAGSVLASLSGSGGSLITARLIQGIGASAVLPATLSTVNATFRGKDRIVAFAVWGSVISGMAAIGPLAGGAITTYLTWPWIFWINLPIAAAVAVAAIIYVPETQAKITAPGLDVDGFLLSAVGFAAVVFALIEGQTYGWWQPKTDLNLGGLTWPQSAPVSVIPVIAVFGVGLLVLFVFWERHRMRNGRSGLLDLRLFSIPTFSWGNLTALLVAIGEFGLLFVLPLFMVNALDFSTMTTGLVLAAMAAGAFIAGATARHLAEPIGAAGVVVVGLGLECVGVVATALFGTAHNSPWLLAGLLVIYGLGLGLASAQLTSTVLADVPAQQSGQGSATQSTVRQVGAALGTAILGTILALSVASATTSQLEHVSGTNPHTVQQLSTATSESGGANIGKLRHSNSLGSNTAATVDALSHGFAHGTRTTLLAGAGFLLLGLIGATQLRKQVRTDNQSKENPA
ncbi:MFS transporter [Microlunatus elymi]|uniref:MFS transporter n=1 Tax=Microlunatus elymi TaxID=2596828 RepID=A0A516PW91_9ACTN|nr:MFS transporter [Microlunatus elymi]QDP95402.1 MFS transporter [Microlunatus elymi]